MKEGIRDFILFECLTAPVMAHAMLAGMGTAAQTQVLFYAVLLIMNLICLLIIFVNYKEQFQLVDYNESLNRDNFLYVLGGVVGVLVASTLLSRPYGVNSALYVPLFAEALPLFANLPQIATQILYNFALVANSEETTKLVGHNALYMALVSHFPESEKYAKYVSVVVPVGFWSCLHAYVAYVGPMMWQLVAAAFFSGLIIFAVMWKTRSLLAAITVHGLYNVIVMTASTLGLLKAPVAYVYPLGLCAFAAFNTILLVKLRRARNRLT